MGLRMIQTAGDCGGKLRTSSRVEGAGRLEGSGGGTILNFLRRKMCEGPHKTDISGGPRAGRLA